MNMKELFKILKVLEGYEIKVIDVDDIPEGLINFPETEPEYLLEKINEALEVENNE